MVGRWCSSVDSRWLARQVLWVALFDRATRHRPQMVEHALTHRAVVRLTVAQHRAQRPIRGDESCPKRWIVFACAGRRQGQQRREGRELLTVMRLAVLQLSA